MPHQLGAFTGSRRWVSPPSDAPGLPQRVQVGEPSSRLPPCDEYLTAGFEPAFFLPCKPGECNKPPRHLSNPVNQPLTTPGLMTVARTVGRTVTVATAARSDAARTSFGAEVGT